MNGLIILSLKRDTPEFTITPGLKITLLGDLEVSLQRGGSGLLVGEGNGSSGKNLWLKILWQVYHRFPYIKIRRIYDYGMALPHIVSQ